MSSKIGGYAKTVGGLGISGLVVWGLVLASSPKVTPVAAAKPAAAPSGPVAGLTSLSDAFSSVAEGIKPSVVYITSKRPGGAEPAAFDIPPEFRQFFGVPDGEGRSGHHRVQLQTASGSGFVVSPDGYILTNDHVVEGATQVRVRLLDRREFDAKVVGTDPATDVAVLRIDAPNLSPAPLGRSGTTRVGEWVLAVGNPFGENLTFTVTQGIISAKGRALDLPNRSARSIQDFIQTDAAINPGNSGGPLVNMRGEVIGINSAIASETGTYSGYGFAIPVDLARKVMEQLIKSGRVERAALGILARDATAEDAAYAGLDRISGVLVEEVPTGSGASAAGIVPGDLIVGVDGRPIDYVAELQKRVAFKHPGDRVAVDVARKGGRRVTLEVKLSTAPTERVRVKPAAATGSAENESTDLPALGASFAPIDERAAQEWQIPDSVRGLIVTEVDEDGPSAQRLAAPQQGPDIVEAVEGEAVSSIGEIRRILAREHPNDIVSLRVWNARSQSSRIERIKLGESR